MMTVSLNVLEHLGLNLYSNVPAVLSEAVANSWDADAERVWIDIDPDEAEISISDDGHGMSERDVNERFLYVGYRRRQDEQRPNVTPEFERPVMGRKGIGKLSLFSIAKTVDVYTSDGNDKNSFRMDVDEMREMMEKEDVEGAHAIYRPKELEDFPEDLNQGTKVVLSDLKKQIQTRLTEQYLRKRLARRFGILGEEYNFKIILNGKPVTFDDRDYFHKLQLLFRYGDDSEKYLNRCENLEFQEQRESEIGGGFQVRGWIGTVDKPSALRDGRDDLNKISIMMRGKLAQEDILEDTNISEIFSEYVIGVIHADFLDKDELDDVATSSRERIIKDDPRYQSLREFVENELREIGRVWNEFRTDKGEEEARSIPAVDDWFNSLSEDNQARARELFGTINQMSVDKEEDKKRLFKHSVLAFENLRYRDNLDKLDRISPGNVGELARIFDDLDDIEASLYYQIVSQRLDIIEEMSDKIEDDALDDVLEKHIYDHPWLLDPAWERATGSGEIEEQVREEFKRIDQKLEPEERKGRVDVKYMKTTGQHIIIDLRQTDRSFSRKTLVNQLSDYRQALKRILAREERRDEPIEIVSVVGKDIEEWSSGRGEEETTRMLGAINARVLKYDELLENARSSYQRYLDQQEKADRIRELVDSIESSEIF